ncbi:hypothetical protein A3C23_05250 [Candidatus Roizmanbacteria bacterium RIFCSPHIGHO2_02_FULL_37_13b]|uniref:BioF2-like acetyltransferase domain-containing protein n=1 Tax=Candidatus Roizmanbacteria bacterium RIFCSPLOWO2_02_FULL_36_11 TaxID=1802071 RepID=A0A1F7JCM0_9BACT|nr:MAG: hypothetical protein A3C23_05250 [Candidatus Roizmanbacteria bacterium RIFCSPHIGHO2_02_FULL_37_13b]OGK53349.1 MAG: hypothetical protein A3H78_03540 [Candidatus Roizmanbacteria bacterium RIFCSPLOWO2_02_FULL_36_11]
MAASNQSNEELVQEEKPPTVSNNLLPFYSYWKKEKAPKEVKNYYSKNGHLKLIKSLTIEISSSLDQCQNLWNEFNQNRTLFDTWEFRKAFYESYDPDLHFIVLKNNSENLALLPLQYERDSNRYVWFGSPWQEESVFFVKDPLFIPLLLGVCPTPLYLNAINKEALIWAKDLIDFAADDPKFILNLSNIQTPEDFLYSLKKKRRYNLKRDVKHIESQFPQIVINNFSDFDKLVDLNIKRFEQKGEDTDWEDPRRIATFRHVLRLGLLKKSFHIRMVSVYIKDHIAACDLIAIYKKCYYPLKCGYDVANFPGIGNFMNFFEIKDALSLGMKKMDFLEIDYGWKNKWFEEVPLFKYEKDYNSEGQL